MVSPLRRGVASSQVSDWLGNSEVAVPSQNLWTPYALRNIIAWWDASVDSTFTFSSGTSVSQWDSLIGGHSFVQGSAAKQPSRSGTLNGLSTVVFDGSNDSMSTSSTVDMTGSQTFSIWAVFTAASGGNQVIIEQTTNFNNTAGAWLVYRNSANVLDFSKRGVGSYSAVASAETITSTAKACVGIHDGALATVESQTSVNLDFRQTLPINNNTNSDNINQSIFLGARNNAASFLNGVIAEVGICTSVFTLDETIKLNDYLRAKWGI